MNTEQRLNQLEARLDNLQQAFIQAQRNQVPTTSKVYDTASKVTEITPTTFTKKASIDATSVTFEDVPSGNMTVYCPVAYTSTRIGNRVVVEFDALKEATDITISII
jgi:hypothetical protein